MAFPYIRNLQIPEVERRSLQPDLDLVISGVRNVDFFQNKAFDPIRAPKDPLLRSHVYTALRLVGRELTAGIATLWSGYSNERYQSEVFECDIENESYKEQEGNSPQLKPLYLIDKRVPRLINSS